MQTSTSAATNITRHRVHGGPFDVVSGNFGEESPPDAIVAAIRTNTIQVRRRPEDVASRSSRGHDPTTASASYLSEIVENAAPGSDGRTSVSGPSLNETKRPTSSRQLSPPWSASEMATSGTARAGDPRVRLREMVELHAGVSSRGEDPTGTGRFKDAAGADHRPTTSVLRWARTMHNIAVLTSSRGKEGVPRARRALRENKDDATDVGGNSTSYNMLSSSA